MGHDYDTLRADADYELRRRDGGTSKWILRDKRTNHRWAFTHVQPHGYEDNVFLRRLSAFEKKRGHAPSSGNRVAILDKESLPEWLIEEFEHIYETGRCTPATDPRGEDDG